MENDNAYNWQQGMAATTRAELAAAEAAAAPQRAFEEARRIDLQRRRAEREA